MNIPIAHIHGGEITEGAIDDKIRHSITKMSSLHFTSTDEYRNRVIQMGEPSDMVLCVGAPGIDNIVNINLLSRSELEDELGWKFNGVTALFTFHSETLSAVDTRKEIKTILEAMGNFNINVLFTYANSDHGGRVINNEVEKFAAKDKERYLVVKSLGQLKYLSAMKHLDFVIGNSSSGIIEAASFQKPVINIGNRQLGRLQSGNVIDSTIDKLEESINEVTSENFIEHCNNVVNIYGDGNASCHIVAFLEGQNLSPVKKFNDL
jgi:GDP/UDP-N,N'-diacetylbacillosamine 2-epimerase (hydrolysing)